MKKQGLRQRKQQQTREKITAAAMTLFVEKGFEAVTVDEIATNAEVGRQSFFNYFGSKEDVVYAWQSRYQVALVEAIASRPASEPIRRTVECAVTSSMLAMDEPSFAITKLILETPALRKRDHLLYLEIENALVKVLIDRYPKTNIMEIRIVSMVAAGVLRISSELLYENNIVRPVTEDFIDSLFRQLWSIDGRVIDASH